MVIDANGYRCWSYGSVVRGAPSDPHRAFAAHFRSFCSQHSISVATRSMGRKKSGSKGCRSSKSGGIHARKMRCNENGDRNGDGIGNGNGKDYENGNEIEESNKFCEKREDGKSKDPIDVYSRLSYPLVRQSLPEDLDGSDKENASLELTVKPRFVFVSSLCAVCLDRSKVLCEHCRMVSYCSPAHRDRRSREHRDLCEALAEIRASIASTVPVDSNHRLDAEQYRVFRLRLLAILESRCGRPLQLWEREIVLYPRVCRVCRGFGENLICCAACGMECFCPGHREEHGKWCEEFRVLRRCLSLQHKHGCVEPKIPRRKRRESVVDENRERVSDIGFDELMRRVYGDCSYYREMDSCTYSMLSQLCTIPLTTLYAMEISRSEWRDKPELAVHVLGAEFQFEGVNLHVWERMFLHLLPKLKKLRVTLVGPELQLPSGVPVHLLSRVKLCSECKAAGRVVVVRYRPNTLYHEMSRTEGVAEKPDIVCAFNPGLYRRTGFAGKDTWPETIREFSKMRTPVVVTSYTEQEIFWEIDRIKSIDREVDVLLEPRRNPFASIKPDRNFVSDHTNPLIYKNYYVTVVEGRSLST
ncbi:uncharacterized protein LOC143352781 [Halictus rubicundus]|uniref:uncharacterized protein LOC143352781 n=1 Tax=Halictus rubicundus TaxID=77578 RepID=UPI004037458F